MSNIWDLTGGGASNSCNPYNLYSPIRIILCGASFEQINGSLQDRPHTGEYLQAIMAPQGHVLKVISTPGALCSDFTQAITDHESNILNPANPWYKADVGILGLSGEQIGDSNTGPPYTTLAEISRSLEAFQTYTHKQYALRVFSSRGLDWCWIRAGQPDFSDAKWDAYGTAWDQYMAENHPDVEVIDCYEGLTDSKEYSAIFVPWGDWHVSTASARVAAERIWAQVLRSVSAQAYYPTDWSPETC